MIQSQLQEALQWRYAVKKFDASKKIGEQDWSALQAALVQAPSSYGLQPWKFLVIQNPVLREKLKSVSWNQTQVTDCSHYVVMLAKEKIDEKHVQDYISRIAELRQIPAESLKGFQDMMLTNAVHGKVGPEALTWNQKQIYIAMGFLLEAAALLKVDACPMEGLDPAKYDEILNLNGSGWRTVATVALGYRHAEDSLQAAKKVRFPTERIVEFLR